MPMLEYLAQKFGKTCINCVGIFGNNRLEYTVCKDVYHYRCSVPITLKLKIIGNALNAALRGVTGGSRCGLC